MRTTVRYFRQQKQRGIPIAMLTAYDATTARIAEKAGIRVLLVGDTLGMVVQGQMNTLPVTMDEMIYHTKMVSRAVVNALVVGDMPFMSYQIAEEEAVRNAGRFIKEGGASAVKIEGGYCAIDKIRAGARLDKAPPIA